VTIGVEALLVFYGLFWAAALVAVGRYRLFDAHALHEHAPTGGRRLMVRMVVGVTVMNVLPLLWVVFALLPIVQPLRGTGAVLVGGIVSLTAFGWQRLLHATVAFPPLCRHLYTPAEWNRVTRVMTGAGMPMGKPAAHAVEGLLYLTVPLAASYLLSPAPIGWQTAGVAVALSLLGVITVSIVQPKLTR
jgi:hypothetical protein